MFNTSVRYFPVYSLAPYSDNLYTEKGARGRQEEGIGEKDGGRRWKTGRKYGGIWVVKRKGVTGAGG